MRTCLPLILFFLNISFGGFAQDYWYFGQNAGLHFGNTVTVLTNSAMNTPEGCASAGYGNSLLFYTNGQTIWNANHNIMNNGAGLNGSPHASQSAVIATPDGVTNFYVFTVDALAGNNGLRYSHIDMSMGAVVEKNVFLQANMTEKLTVIQHCNKRDAWVLSHEWGTNRFFAWLVTKDGVDPNPVISAVGSVHSGNIHNTRGYMKVNRNQDMIALCIQNAGKVELFDFDNTFGTVSNPVTVSNVSNAYGVEFSNNDLLLYVTTSAGELFQFSLVNYNSQDIAASRTLIAISNNLFGAVQLGPDLKLYVAQDLSSFLGVINNPDAFGSGCNFVPQGVFLGGKKSEAGLPPRINEVLLPSYSVNEPCLGDTSVFLYWAPYEVDSVLWKFGDTLASPHDTSTADEGRWVYPAAGTYETMLILFRCNSSDTLIRNAYVKDLPNPNLGPDTAICDNQPYTLSPGSGTSYIWSTGATSPMISVSQAGVYWVEVSNACGSRSDTVEIKDVYPSPVFSLGNDTTMCLGDTLILCLDTSLGSFAWSTGDTLPCLKIYETRNYLLHITNEFNCTAHDNKLVQFLDTPKVCLGNDTTICIGYTVLLNAGNQGQHYLWNNGTTSDELVVYETGEYSVTVTNQCGWSSASVKIIVDDCEKTIWIPSAFMPETQGENRVFVVKGLNVSNFELTVFNRFGELLFKSNDINIGWDGTFKGELCQMGVYVWTLRYNDFHGQTYYHSGTLTLLR